MHYGRKKKGIGIYALLGFAYFYDLRASFDGDYVESGPPFQYLENHVIFFTMKRTTVYKYNCVLK